MKPITHKKLSRAPYAWLNRRVTQRGIRGDIEIRVADGYIADFFALCFLDAENYTEESSELSPNVHHRYRECCCLFEAKVTRSDFLATFGDPDGHHSNRHKPIANLHWCVTPRGLIKPEELPDFWGLLEWTGRGLSVSKKPIFNELSGEKQDDLAHRLLWGIETWSKYWGLWEKAYKLERENADLRKESPMTEKKWSDKQITDAISGLTAYANRGLGFFATPTNQSIRNIASMLQQLLAERELGERAQALLDNHPNVESEFGATFDLGREAGIQLCLARLKGKSDDN